MRQEDPSDVEIEDLENSSPYSHVVQSRTLGNSKRSSKKQDKDE